MNGRIQNIKQEQETVTKILLFSIVNCTRVGPLNQRGFSGLIPPFIPLTQKGGPCCDLL